MTTTISISIDVPSLSESIAFYCAAFGFSEKSQPVPGVAALHGLNIELCLLEKPAGSKPSPNTNDQRKYERHWTPVHLDVHVEDLHIALNELRRLSPSASKSSRIQSMGLLRFAAIHSVMVSVYSSDEANNEAAAAATR